jgi:hypothetical protein
LAAVVVAVLATGCVPHPVGPARTIAAYRDKARTTVESAMSELETVVLIAEQASADRAFGRFTAVVLSDAEESLDGLDGTFASIQPPPDGDDLRTRLGAVLSDAGDHVADVRIAARRGSLRDLSDVAAPIEDDLAALEQLLEELS